MLVEGTPVICAQPSTNSLSAAYTLQSLGSHPGMHPGAVQAVAYEVRGRTASAQRSPRADRGGPRR